VSRREDQFSRGQYRAAGYAIVGMGTLAAALYVAATLAQVELGFITGEGILGIGVAFVAVGAWMVTSADRPT